MNLLVKRGGEGRGRRVVMCNGEGLVGWVWLVGSRFVRVIVGFPTKWFPVGDTMSIIQVLEYSSTSTRTAAGAREVFFV